jgi:hypothetical protein
MSPQSPFVEEISELISVVMLLIARCAADAREQ